MAVTFAPTVAVTTSSTHERHVHSVPDDGAVAPLCRTAATESLDLAVAQHERLLEIGGRLLQQASAILAAPAPMTLFVPLRLHGELRLLYPALAPAPNPPGGADLADHVTAFHGGEPTLTTGGALLLPVFGHDGLVCCLA